MRLRRFEQQRGSYDDLLDIPRHLAALHRYDDIAGIAGQAARMLPGTLATVAYLAEIRPLIPAAERAWILVADLEVQALLSAGDLPAATRQLHAIHQQVQARAAADPANTEWQRDLSVSHNRLGDVAIAAGDLAAARDRLPGQPGHRRAGWPPPTPPTPNGSATCPSATTGSGTWRRRPGTWPPPATTYQASLDIRARLAAADPANTDWQRDLSVSHNKLGDVAAAAGDLTAARDRLPGRPGHRAPGWPPPTPPTPNGSATCRSATTSWGTWRWRPGTWPPPATDYQAGLDIARPAGRRRPRQHRMAARPVGQPQQARGRGGRGRGPGRRPRPTTRPPGHRRPAGRRRPRQHRMAARPVHQPRTSSGTWRSRPGTWPPPATAYQAAWTSATRLAAADPANTGWQRDLSVSHNKLGDVAVAAGDLAAARDRLPGQPGHRAPGWPPPTPPTPNGSATCRSATTSSGTWRQRPGT